MGSKQKKFKNASTHKKLKGKRWKKGQSSSSNPETKRYREAAKNRFFTPQTGSSNLTVDALAKHDEKHIDVDVDSINQDSDAHSATGKTFNTWATNWTECTNATFGKVHRYWASNSAQHREILAVLAAVTEVIKSQGGAETETEYFAALMSVLETTDSVESLTAIAYLLNLAIKKVPAAVLQSRFAEVSRLILDMLATHADQDATSLLKSLLLSLAAVLRVQEKAVWSNTSTQRVFQGFLTFITHKKPKVRKAAHRGILVVLKGSSFLSQGGTTHHPAAVLTAKFCMQKIEECGGTGEALDTLHTLVLLKDILSCLPLNSVKSTCETILRVMTLSNVMVKSCGMQALYGLFSAKPPSTTLSAELNAQIITALYEYQPSDNDVQPMNAWFAVMEKAHINLARLDDRLSVNHLPRLFSVAMTCLMSEKMEVATAATKTMKILLKECLAPSVSSLKAMVESSADGTTPVHKIVKAAEAGLSYQFFAAWGLVMQLFAVLFEVIGKDCPQLLKKSLQSISELRDSPKFPYKPELDHAIGCAVKYMGPRHVIDAVPLKITGDNDDYSFPRSWLLPVIRDNVCNTELGFFVSYFLPLAAKLRQRSLEASQTGNPVVSKSYDVLQSQIWSLLPGFCSNPTDLLQSFKGIARILGSAISDRVDLRIEVMSSLRKLISKSLEDDATQKEVGRFAKNFLPILLNVFTTEPETGKDHTRLAALETAKCYMEVADSQLVASFCDKCLDKMNEEGLTAFKGNALLDLSIGMLPYIDSTRVQHIYQSAKTNLQSSDRTTQKKSYRVLEEICGQTSAGCQEFIQKNLAEVQSLLLESLSTSSPSSKAPRLRCLSNVFKLIEQEQQEFLCAVVPEAILCTREVAGKARAAAYSLLVEMGHAQIKWSSGTSETADALRRYFKLVMAGLAGSPQMVSSTLLALTRILYAFKDHVDGLLLEMIVDSISLLLTAKPREIVKATLGFVKVLLSVYQDTTLAPHLKTLMASLVSMKEDCHHHFRFKTKEIFSKLIKKFGYETIYGMSPASVHKVLANIRKTQERAKKKKKEKENDEGDESEEEHFRSQPENVEDLLQDTDSEMEDDDKKGKKKSSKAQKQGKSGQAWLQEGDENAFVDFLDPTASKKVLATRPMKKESTKPKETGFKTAPDGRLIIQDDNKDDGGSDMEDEDDLDELLEAMEKGSGATKRSKKRKVEDLGSDDEASAPKYKAGGSGIHRPIAKAKHSTDLKSDTGSEYRAKKAGGDVKKKGKHDPYTYVPLNFQALNRRKKKKLQGRFNNLVKGAKKGAMKGSKGKKKKG